eukprot:CAMPEP_0113899780 /NCGR_PEP_ID=MMETSP0780_2-20120614/20259_1 /TAXON_ID=652834 /ORGANISM="Palpitomonas bilix" /LENGTH=101 /DNA_ID=CAMNT_0000892061 /DNA_START=107 /DNA_END=412 /DNA_ORIENTATION=+ /assembly_acc=CAM_ASM_000599
MSFGSSYDTPLDDGTSGDFHAGSATQVDQLKGQIRSEVDAQQVQALISTMNKKCFKACVTSPSSSLSSSETACIERCVERYREALREVSQALVHAAKKQQM